MDMCLHPQFTAPLQHREADHVHSVYGTPALSLPCRQQRAANEAKQSTGWNEGDLAPFLLNSLPLSYPDGYRDIWVASNTGRLLASAASDRQAASLTRDQVCKSL